MVLGAYPRQTSASKVGSSGRTGVRFTFNRLGLIRLDGVPAGATMQSKQLDKKSNSIGQSRDLCQETEQEGASRGLL